MFINPLVYAGSFFENFNIVYEDSNNRKIREELSSYLNKLYNIEGFQGEVLVYKDGHVLFNESYGNRKNDKYLIGSISKQFVGMSVLNLQKEGKINIDESIDKYFPDYKHGEKIKIKDLLNHSSGIKDFIDYKNLAKMKLDSGIDNYIFSSIMKGELLFKPGTSYYYSNSNYYLLSLILEDITKMPLEEYLDKNIFKPFKMKNTSNISKNSKITDKSFPVLPVDIDLEKLLVSKVKGAGYLYSNTEDLLRYLNIISKKLDSQTLNFILKEGNKFSSSRSYNFGFKYADSILGKKLYHNGNTLGFTSNFTSYLDKDIKIVVLSNIGEYDIDRLLLNIERIIDLKKYKEPSEKIDDNVLGSYGLFGFNLGRIYKDKGKYYISILDIENMKLFKKDDKILSVRNSSLEIKPIYNNQGGVDYIHISPYNIKFKRVK